MRRKRRVGRHRRLRRRRNLMELFNPRRRRHHRRHRNAFNPRRHRRHRLLRRRNPGVVGSLAQAFKMDVLKQAGFMLAGAVGTSMLRNVVTSKVLPLSIAQGPAKHLVGLASAGLLALGAGKVMSGSEKSVLMGGVLSEALAATQEYMPSIYTLGSTLGRLLGLGDYISPTQLTRAQPLSNMSDASLSVGQLQRASQLRGTSDFGLDEDNEM